MGLASDKPADYILCFHPNGKVNVFATNLYAVFGLSYLDGKLYVHHWDLYRSAEDVAVASEHLESVLRLLPGLDEPARTYIIAEAAYFTAWQRPNEMIADVWFKRIRRLDWLGKIERCRVEIARLSLQNKNDEALKECQNTISFIQQHVDGPVSKQIESSWLKWREQIHQRVLPEPAVVSSAAGIE